MVSVLPIPGGFITLATRCLSPMIVPDPLSADVTNHKGFICGWTYWFARVISFANQLVAAQNIMTIWVEDDKLRSVWISIFWLAVVLFNFFNVRRFGEIEYWLTVVKIETYLGLIILGILLPMGASIATRLLATGPDNTVAPCPSVSLPGQCLDPPGFACNISTTVSMLTSDWGNGLAFKEYFYHGGFGRLVGFWAACTEAIFAYGGLEIIGICAEETERPRETLPRVVPVVAHRIVFYYVGAVFVLGLNVSSIDPILAYIATKSYISPFVLMVQRAGIIGLTNVINAVALIIVLSVANTRVYICVRASDYIVIDIRVEYCTHSQRKDRLSQSSKRRYCGVSQSMA